MCEGCIGPYCWHGGDGAGGGERGLSEPASDGTGGPDTEGSHCSDHGRACVSWGGLMWWLSDDVQGGVLAFCAYEGLKACCCLETLESLDLESLCAFGGGDDIGMAQGLSLSSSSSWCFCTGGWAGADNGG